MAKPTTIDEVFGQKQIVRNALKSALNMLPPFPDVLDMTVEEVEVILCSHDVAFRQVKEFVAAKNALAALQAFDNLAM